MLSVQQIENDGQVAYRIETESGSSYTLSDPDEELLREIVKMQEGQEGKEMKFRGRMYGIAVENPSEKIGSLLKDGRWATPTKAISVGQYAVLLRDDKQFTVTGKITALFID